MSNGPRVVVEEPGEFRIVRVEDGDKVSHVVEVPDGCDALGAERWRSLEMKNVKPFGMFLSYILRQIAKGEQDGHAG